MAFEPIKRKTYIKAKERPHKTLGGFKYKPIKDSKKKKKTQGASDFSPT